MIDTTMLRRAFGGGGRPAHIGAATIVHLACAAELTNGAYHHEQHSAADPLRQRQLSEATVSLLATHLAALPGYPQP